MSSTINPATFHASAPTWNCQGSRSASSLCVQVPEPRLCHGRLNANDRRGITPLIYAHVNPYGSCQLDLNPVAHRSALIRPSIGRNSAPAPYMTSKRGDRLPPLVTAMLTRLANYSLCIESFAPEGDFKLRKIRTFSSTAVQHSRPGTT